MSVYAFDIDGTIANNDHRQWVIDEAKPSAPNRRPIPNWELFFQLMINDAPIEHMRTLAVDLATNDNNSVVYFSGRPERFRGMTIQWMHEHDFPIGMVFMRADGDHRPDEIVKRELYLEYLKDADNEQPVMVFDDRNKVVAMWRAIGVPCMHVTDKGDF